LARSLPPPRQGLRGHNRQRGRMGPRRTCPHSHATHRKDLTANRIISSQSDGVIGVSAEGC
jgi:hypothetical protein